MVDFHTHILHDIDDGSASVQMSVAMVKKLQEQGVSSVVLTPHFYAYLSSSDVFVERRESALKELVKELDSESVKIDLYLGCETLYFDELWRVEDLREFCIRGTDYIIVEMPFSQWTDSLVTGIEKIIGMGLTPILAHFERYLPYKGNLLKIQHLVSVGALLQLNCDSLVKFSTRRRALKFIRRGMVFALGTDSHDLEKRGPNYDKAVEYLKNKISEKALHRLTSGPKCLLRGAEKVYCGK